MDVPGNVTELYSDREIEKLAKKIKVWTYVLLALGLAGLAACVTMAATVTTANASKMEMASIIVSIVTGWLILYCALFVVRAARLEYGHARMLKTEERERVEGVVRVTKERLIIRKSIAARRVEVETADGVARLWVIEERAGRLSRANATAVHAAHGYVAAYEVTR